MYFVVSAVVAFLIALSIGFFAWQNNLFVPEINTGMAQPPAQPVDVRELSNENLISELLSGMKALDSSYEAQLGLRMSQYFHEYASRGLKNSHVESLNQSLVEKNGACWGLPEGQCLE